jgi:phosphatidylserine synthase
MTATLAKIMAVATSAGTMVDSVADSLSAEVSPAAVVASMVEADRMVVDAAKRRFC